MTTTDSQPTRQGQPFKEWLAEQMKDPEFATAFEAEQLNLSAPNTPPDRLWIDQTPRHLPNLWTCHLEQVSEDVVPYRVDLDVAPADDDESSADLAARIIQVNAHPLMEELSQAMQLNMEAGCDCPDPSFGCEGKCLPGRVGESLHRLRKRLRAYIESATPSADDEEVARQIYDALAANDDINTWHKDTLLPMITQIVAAALAANRKAVVDRVIEKVRPMRDTAELRASVEFLVEGKRQAFIAGADAMHNEILTELEQLREE